MRRLENKIIRYNFYNINDLTYSMWDIIDYSTLINLKLYYLWEDFIKIE